MEETMSAIFEVKMIYSRAITYIHVVVASVVVVTRVSQLAPT